MVPLKCFFYCKKHDDDENLDGDFIVLFCFILLLISLKITNTQLNQHVLVLL